MWEKGELGSSTPTKLIQTLFYLNGLHFGIRGGAEHHNLCIDHFEIEIFNGIECLVYKEKSTKTYKGGMEQRKLSPKVKRYFENTDLPKEKCHIKLFKMFIEHRPPTTENLYLQSKKDGTSQDAWYTTRPIGINTLQKMLKRMFVNAGLSNDVTNRSLRATLATPRAFTTKAWMNRS